MKDDCVAMKSEEEPGEENNSRAFSLGENTPVRLGLVIAVVGLVLSAVVWNATNAAKVNAKLDTLTGMVSKVANASEINERRVSDHIADDRRMWTEVEARLAVLERSGSEKARELERDLGVLRREFEVHRAIGPITEGRIK